MPTITPATHRDVIKIGEAFSEFHRDVVQILKSREENSSQNQVVSNLSPL